VRQPAEFGAALEGAQREAQAAFGDSTVFIEKLIERPRHVEIQIFADSHGTVLHLGERECSIQRRHQKILEESPSPALSPALRQEMGEAAVRAARSAGYVNAGTVEFVLDQQGRYYFLEMNTRLQVEHPVTELVTGLDLVHLQFAVAAGQPLPFGQEQVHVRGHAIEVRLYAEDPVTFLPAIGRLALHEPPSGPGVRVDSGLTTGDEVTVHYDPMIAKLIVNGPDRPAAIARLQEALDSYAVLGLTTNLPLLRALVAHPAYAAGDTHTGFLSEHPLDVAPPPSTPAAVFLAAAVVKMQEEAQKPQRNDPFAQLWRLSGLQIPLRLRIGEAIHLLAVSRIGGKDFTVEWGNEAYTFSIGSIQPTSLAIEISKPTPQQVLVTYAYEQETNDLLISYQGYGYRVARPAVLSGDSAGQGSTGHDGASLTAPMPGTLIKLMVQAGDTVTEGQPLLVLEAMKMEHTISAPYAGIVRSIPFAAGASVAGGVELIELVPYEAN
jgi:3-methylcrotonyl-CoA carboxylase alpha subunit